MKYKYTIEQLKISVSNSLSISQTCRELGIRPVGGNFRTIKSLILKNKIDTSHFTGRAWNKGSRYKSFSKKYNLKDILIEDSPYRSTNALKQRLINEGIKNKCCEICNHTEWLGKDIKLELHHVNGINTDNRIENLQLLCPNCHSYTDNFRGNNIKKSALSEKREVEYRKFRETLTDNADGNPEPSLENKEGAETLHGRPKFKKSQLISNCKNCEKEFRHTQLRTFCSVDCYDIYKSKNRPSVIELLDVMETYKFNFSAIGRHYNVSDNAIRKWCNLYKILDMVKRKSRPQNTGNSV